MKVKELISLLAAHPDADVCLNDDEVILDADFVGERNVVIIKSGKMPLEEKYYTPIIELIMWADSFSDLRDDDLLFRIVQVVHRLRPKNGVNGVPDAYLEGLNEFNSFDEDKQLEIVRSVLGIEEGTGYPK